MADCSKLVGSEQQIKICVLGVLLSVTKILELLTWEGKNNLGLCVLKGDRTKKSLQDNPLTA